MVKATSDSVFPSFNNFLAFSVFLLLGFDSLRVWFLDLLVLVQGLFQALSSLKPGRFDLTIAINVDQLHEIVLRRLLLLVFTNVQVRNLVVFVFSDVRDHVKIELLRVLLKLLLESSSLLKRSFNDIIQLVGNVLFLVAF